RRGPSGRAARTAARTTSPPAALAAAPGLMLMRTWSVPAPQGPAGSLLVSVSVTPPAAISAALGVYVALSAEALGLYEPLPPLHEPLAPPPPTAPASTTRGLAEHTICSAPA